MEWARNSTGLIPFSLKDTLFQRFLLKTWHSAAHRYLICDTLIFGEGMVKTALQWGKWGNFGKTLFKKNNTSVIGHIEVQSWPDAGNQRNRAIGHYVEFHSVGTLLTGEHLDSVQNDFL